MCKMSYLIRALIPVWAVELGDIQKVFDELAGHKANQKSNLCLEHMQVWQFDYIDRKLQTQNTCTAKTHNAPLQNLHRHKNYDINRAQALAYN